MAPLVLKYFDFTGAAEGIRWALEIAGVEWEDKRLSREEFMELKPCKLCTQMHVDDLWK